MMIALVLLPALTLAADLKIMTKGLDGATLKYSCGKLKSQKTVRSVTQIKNIPIGATCVFTLSRSGATSSSFKYDVTRGFSTISLETKTIGKKIFVYVRK